MQPVFETLNPIYLITFENVWLSLAQLSLELICIKKMCYDLMWNYFPEQGVLTCFSFLFTGGSVFLFKHIVCYALIFL